MSARTPSSRRVMPASHAEVPEADRLEQELAVTPDEEASPSRTVSAADIFGANEADVAEQLQEVPDDEDYPHQ
ncbi:hypothetical protein ONR57_04690 [Hoyosella sp. YIM 151337]|uniref:hypothetical protein n=1 Tax=Hoyosella sp. YIM 151337 TaxID=2992742 RepID=UPI002236A5DC|nr:hypothetical protein [Hoyosella sp. YIM 151337]MCW4352596.1 hypothetical protein [Hoyosella sp. YIM 151337]